ncbi:glycosyltransferase 25 family member [Trichonephila inaurata madagascariensis]|uniref:Glycosyltransferase 25 family member n=1 Tax=Trichonephila inaurata madagascariensis TaxID=2747483 RepID=A0A8X6MLS6_9ARAC|nr:glycosyltransferase 25 family member [Trichonephila inaurata madagascariensis]
MKNDSLKPTIIISILARNKAHTLPYFFGYLEKLDYPRDRISLWIRSDHNIDNTNDVLKTWLVANRKFYHSVDFSYEEHPESFSDGTGVFEWSSSHFEHLIHLKETALLAARKLWADYIMFLDCDVFLVNNNTLNLLMKEDKTIIAPVLETLGAYSNYWCGMTEQGYYKRTDDYLPILEREQIGCFDVPMVHSAVLINLRHKNSLQLTFDPKKIDGYSGPVDDIIIFAHSARTAGVKMWVTNEEPFGYMLTPLEKENTLQDDREQLQNLKVEMMVEYPQIYISPSLQHFVPKKPEDTAGFDQAYLINLERRPERRERMLNTLSEMGIQAHILKAVDGKALNDSFIEEMGIKMLPEYADPYYKRPLTRGEIGCFLSHYHVWKDMIEHQHRTAIVLEDDLRFEPYFRKKIQALLKEVQKVGLLWDLIYLGRKRLSENGEPFVAGTSSLVHVNYSYWTLCYLITLEGAKKLVMANPLPKLVPVDEFLPIMFDRHPEEVWKGYYPKRNLRAFSAQPLLVYPTHYTGETNYISDTEDSDLALSVVKRDEL